MKEATFKNQIQPFRIGGRYIDKDIIELYLDCSCQHCSSAVDFFSKWRIEDNKVILELTPKWVTEGGELEMTIFKDGKGDRWI